MVQEQNIEMVKLKERLNQIKDLIPENTGVYYFDYPVHSNIGDMLIWQGTENFFLENNIEVIKRFSFHSVSRILKSGKKINIPRNCPIICHGGGNFGDLYSVHQELRKLLIENYPEHRIILLPQTIYYKEEANLKNDFALISKHKDLHLFVRDETSYSIAKSYLNNVYLSPDMAHSLYPISSEIVNNKRILYFLRNDIENTTKQKKYLSKNMKPFDWDQLFNSLDITILRILSKFHSHSKINALIPTNINAKLWSIYVNYMINKAIAMYNQHEQIVTSRLHGHILACLMDKNNSLIDNSYGKNSSYFKLWTKVINNTNLLE